MFAEHSKTTQHKAGHTYVRMCTYIYSFYHHVCTLTYSSTHRSQACIRADIHIHTYVYIPGRSGGRMFRRRSRRRYLSGRRDKKCRRLCHSADGNVKPPPAKTTSWLQLVGLSKANYKHVVLRQTRTQTAEQPTTCALIRIGPVLTRLILRLRQWHKLFCSAAGSDVDTEPGTFLKVWVRAGK